MRSVGGYGSSASSGGWLKRNNKGVKYRKQPVAWRKKYAISVRGSQPSPGGGRAANRGGEQLKGLRLAAASRKRLKLVAKAHQPNVGGVKRRKTLARKAVMAAKWRRNVAIIVVMANQWLLISNLEENESVM